MISQFYDFTIDRIASIYNWGGGAYGARTRDPMRDRHVF